LSGTGCPTQGTPVFSGIFSEDTIAHSNYNSLQVLFEKRFSHGLQFQASYTFSKSLDNASSFESALNPLNFNSTYGLSNYDARHRFVSSPSTREVRFVRLALARLPKPLIRPLLAASRPPVTHSIPIHLRMPPSIPERSATRRAPFAAAPASTTRT
jgi:hypothetical protein